MSMTDELTAWSRSTEATAAITAQPPCLPLACEHSICFHRFATQGERRMHYKTAHHALGDGVGACGDTLACRCWGGP